MSLSLRGTLNRDIDAFVLAGGRSSRMGQDKALVPLRGQPLVEHGLGILRDAGTQPRIAGGGQSFASFAPVIDDEPSEAGGGPLSGICSALNQSTASYGLFLPVDMPLVPAGLITCLIEHAAITQSAITLMSVAGFIETSPVIVNRSAAPVLLGSLQSGDRKCLKAFQMAAEQAKEPISVVPVELLLQAGRIGRSGSLLPAHWFLNVNTPQNLELAEALLTSRDQVS